MSWLNYHHLFYFRTIAISGGIAAAAVKLRLGQSTLSAQLRQLEDNVGKPLFERRNRKLILTDAGQAALNYANEIFRLGDEMLEVLQDRTVGNQVHLQIGALDGVPKSVLLALVSQAYRVAPCTVSILEGRGDELLRELRAHHLDLIVSNYPAPSGEDLRMHSRSVAKLPVWVYGAAKFRALRRGFPHSLAGKPFVLPTIHSKLRHDLNHYFKLHGLQVAGVAETQDTSLMQLLAEGGLGLAPLTAASGGGLTRLGRLAGVSEEVWLISAQRKLENPVAAKLMRTFSF